MPRFSAIVTSHAFEHGLRNMLGNLMYQTLKPEETIVLFSGYETGAIHRVVEGFGWVDSWVEREYLNDWGHDKRAHGIEIATGDFLGFFNDDDSYHREYLEKMLAAADDDVAAVYCNWNKGKDCGFSLGASTSGNFIVRTSVAKQIGYPWRDYASDGKFINRITELGKAVKVNENLYSHNVIPRP